MDIRPRLTLPDLRVRRHVHPGRPVVCKRRGRPVAPHRPPRFRPRPRHLRHRGAALHRRGVTAQAQGCELCAAWHLHRGGHPLFYRIWHPAVASAVWPGRAPGGSGCVVLAHPIGPSHASGLLAAYSVCICCAHRPAFPSGAPGEDRRGAEVALPELRPSSTGGRCSRVAQQQDRPLGVADYGVARGLRELPCDAAHPHLPGHLRSLPALCPSSRFRPCGASAALRDQRSDVLLQQPLRRGWHSSHAFDDGVHPHGHVAARRVHH
mmetsp:Transcript_101087/g.301550  ORF Transcript_101087/g.301550 Transcript_101087/m.301550 type:complete len:265 (+) Transcript_101087:347-1141(+)